SPSRAVAALRARLVQRRGEGEDRRATEEELHRASRTLRKARRRGERLLRRGAGRRALAEGFADGYRRARAAMTAAGRADTPEAFHAWRKAVKVHAHHARVFADAGVMAERAAPLAALAEALGSAHDLALLEQAIRAECASPASTRAYAPLLAAVQARRQAVERAALAQGRRLFRRPSTWVRGAAGDATGLRNSKR
ncbi:MAG TPA: CHAD domain-containing protein, partial [Polyangia bacterium]|nr:CHAD domain-containing protein [Polyangia bacterium]